MILKLAALLACAAAVSHVAVEAYPAVDSTTLDPPAPRSRSKQERSYPADSYVDDPAPPPPRSRPRSRPSGSGPPPRNERYDPYDDYYNSPDPYVDHGRPPPSRRYPATSDYDPFMLGGAERTSLYRRSRPGLSSYSMGMSPLMAAYMLDMDMLPWE